MADKRPTKKAQRKRRPDWEKIAYELAKRLTLAISSFRLSNEGSGGGLLLNMDKGTSQHWKEYFADGLELIPGVKVDRELMHAKGYSARKKILESRKAKK